MIRNIVAIYSEEAEYVDRLMKYIEQKKRLPFRVIAFTKFQEIEKFLEDEDIQVLLASEKQLGEVKKLKGIRTVACLSEERNFISEEDISCLYKYQSSEELIKELLNLSLENSVLLEGESAEVIGIYSPMNEDKKLALGLLVSLIAAEEKRVLYINLSEFVCIENITGLADGGNISDLMYYYQQNKESVNVKLQALIQKYNNVDVVMPAVYAMDLRQVKAECWVELLEKIAISDFYDVVVVDIGSIIEDVFQVLKICDSIYMPMEENDIQKGKRRMFDTYLLKSGREAILDKVRVVDMSSYFIDEMPIENLLWEKIGKFVKKHMDKEEREFNEI